MVLTQDVNTHNPKVNKQLPHKYMYLLLYSSVGTYVGLYRNSQFNLGSYKNITE